MQCLKNALIASELWVCLHLCLGTNSITHWCFCTINVNVVGKFSNSISMRVVLRSQTIPWKHLGNPQGSVGRTLKTTSLASDRDHNKGGVVGRWISWWLVDMLSHVTFRESLKLTISEGFLFPLNMLGLALSWLQHQCLAKMLWARVYHVPDAKMTRKKQTSWKTGD